MNIIHLFLYILSHFFKKSKKTILFGAWFGFRFSDNSMYLFEYFNNNTDYDCYWVTRDENIYNYLKEKRKGVVMANSIQSLLIHLKAGWVIYSSGKADVVSYLTGGSKKLFLWHGAPMKKILYDDSKHFNRLSWRIKRFLFPYLDELNFDYTLSTSTEFDQIILRSFQCTDKQILRYGYPRNDKFMSENFRQKVLNKDQVKIGYFPTFRDARPNYSVFSNELEFDYRYWLKFNAMNSITWYSSIHYAGVEGFVPNEIQALPNDAFFDLNGVLDEFDIIITDYSGCYWDSLIANSFTILFWPDYEDYIQSSRELNFNVLDFSSPIAFSWKELYNIIEEYLNEDRPKNIPRYNDYNTGDSSKKILELINEHL